MKNQVQKCLEQSLKSQQVKYSENGLTIFVRMFRDKCNISVDCSGEAAFKRGGKAKGSIASLRESTAHALLRVLFQGLQGPFELIDPMCGSGTFLSEALSLHSPLTRDFKFQTFPAFVSPEKGESVFLNQESDGLFLPEKVWGFDTSDQSNWPCPKKTYLSFNRIKFIFKMKTCLVNLQFGLPRKD